MPTRVTVTALTDLQYEGRWVASGEAFAARPVDAAALAYRKKVSLTRARTYQTADERAETPQEDSPRPRRRYRRRDLVPEP